MPLKHIPSASIPVSNYSRLMIKLQTTVMYGRVLSVMNSSEASNYKILYRNLNSHGWECEKLIQMFKLSSWANKEKNHTWFYLIQVLDCDPIQCLPLGLWKEMSTLCAWKSVYVCKNCLKAMVLLLAASGVTWTFIKPIDDNEVFLEGFPIQDAIAYPIL